VTEQAKTTLWFVLLGILATLFVMWIAGDLS